MVIDIRNHTQFNIVKEQKLNTLAGDMQEQILNYRNNIYTYRFKIKQLQDEMLKLQADLQKSRQKFDEICNMPVEEISPDVLKMAV